MFNDWESQGSRQFNNCWDYGELLCAEADNWNEESPADKKRILQGFYAAVKKIRECTTNTTNSNDLPRTVQYAFADSIGPIVNCIEISIKKQGASWWEDGATYQAIGEAIDVDHTQWKLTSRWEKNRIMETFYSIVETRTTGTKQVRTIIDNSIGPFVDEIEDDMKTVIQERIINGGFFEDGIVLTIPQLESTYRLFPDIVNGEMYDEPPVLPAARGDNGSLTENKRRAIQSIPLIPTLVELHQEFADKYGCRDFRVDRYGLISVDLDTGYTDEMNTLQILADCSPINSRNGNHGDDDNSDDESENDDDDDSDEAGDDDYVRDHIDELDQVKLDVMKKLRRQKVFFKSDVKKYDLLHHVCKNVNDGYFSDARFDYLVTFDPIALGSKANSPDFLGRVPLHLCVKNKATFLLLFNAGMDHFPENFGFLFHKDSSKETETPYQLVCKFWSKRSITKLLWKKLKIARKKAGFQERVNTVDGDTDEEEETAVALRRNHRLSTESLIVQAASNPLVSLDCLFLLLLRDPSVAVPIGATLSVATVATADCADKNVYHPSKKGTRNRQKIDRRSNAEIAIKKRKDDWGEVFFPGSDRSHNNVKEQSIPTNLAISPALKRQQPHHSQKRNEDKTTYRQRKRKRTSHCSQKNDEEKPDRESSLSIVEVPKLAQSAFSADENSSTKVAKKKNTKKAEKTTKPKSLLVWITQGKTEHLAEIFDSHVLSVLAGQSLSSKKQHLRSFVAKGSVMDIKWQSTNGIETVDVSAARLFDDESFPSQRGRRSSRRLTI